MLKTLFRKQMSELGAFISFDARNGKQRSKGGRAGYILLLIFVVATLMMSFGGIAMMMCAPLCGMGLGWLYFAVMGMIAIAFGVIGSAFTTYNGLYVAKDNELLLSMPIPTQKLLLVRLLGVYIIGLFYGGTVMIPALVLYYITVPQTALTVILSAVVAIVVSLLTLVLSCVLGWVIAAINSRLKNKSFVTVILSLGFIALYYWGYNKVFAYLSEIAVYGDSLASKFKGALYPFYMMGRGMAGEVLPALGFTAVVAILAAICWIVLNASFIRIVTANRGQNKAQYKERTVSKKSTANALLYKEWKRFSGSATYMLNCGLGVVFMLIMAVAALIKMQSLREISAILFAGNEQYIPLIILAAIGMMASMIDITSPSISLEGKEIWVLQSLPVKASEVLGAKLRLHMLMAEIPTVLLSAVLAFVMQMDISDAILMTVAAYLFVQICAQAGLALNLKMPNLSWTNETAPIKQSTVVMISIFGTWAAVLILGVAYYFLRNVIAPQQYIIICIVIFALVSRLLGGWLRKTGAQIFERL